MGWGATSQAEGVAFPQNPAAMYSIERKAFFHSSIDSMVDAGADGLFGNSYDANNNSLDFVYRDSIPANPQNASSTPEPCCTTVSGTFTLQGRTDHSGIQVLLWPSSNLRTTTDSSGHFSIPTVPAIADADTPTYTVEVSFPGYLTPRTALDLRHQHLPAGVGFQKLALLAGDPNADNQVNIFDLVIAGNQFGNTGLSSADINGDGRVNIQDLALISGNYGQDNEYVWGVE